MTRPILPLALLPALWLMPLAADPVPTDLPPGLRAAHLLPGWTEPDGRRIAALELLLEPGWKTYWRSPGDTGLPPHFEWEGSTNLASVRLHWPAPEAIRSGDRLEMGYHDRLVLPMTLLPQDPSLPVDLSAQISLGLCENICVPAHLDLIAPPPGGAADPAILEALAREPVSRADSPACRITPIADGMRVAMALPGTGADLAAIELPDRPEIWVSGAEIRSEAGQAWAEVEMVGPTAAPFDLDQQTLRLTIIAAGTASEQSGCAE